MCNNYNILVDVTDDEGVVAELADIVADDTDAVVGIVTDCADAVDKVLAKVPGYFFVSDCNNNNNDHYTCKTSSGSSTV